MTGMQRRGSSEQGRRGPLPGVATVLAGLALLAALAPAAADAAAPSVTPTTTTKATETAKAAEMAQAAAMARATSPESASVRVSAGAAHRGAEVAIVRTAGLHVREGLVFAGGDFGKEVLNTFSAIVVRHGEDLFLFDTGLGAQVDAQYDADMPRWQRPFFRYEAPVRPVVAQLVGTGLPPVARIVLSHSHWDHASGLPDFPGAEVWLPAAERAVVAHPHGGVGGAWGSQLAGAGRRWRELRFDAPAYEGFDRHHDVYGDGSVVLVPLSGHTPGSVGMFVTTPRGHRYFFVGDAVWSAAALRAGAPRFWAARWLVDADAVATQAVIGQIRRVQQAHPELVVVPAHDGQVQAALGFFPRWLP